jgi:hypothetical protein
MLPKELSCDYEPVRLAASSIFPQQAAGEPNWRLDGNSVVSRQSSCSRFPRIRLPFAGLPRLPERPNGSHRPVRCLQATHGNATHRRLWQRWIEPTGFKGLGFKGLGFKGLGFKGLGFKGLGFKGLGFKGLGFKGLGFSGQAL